MKKMILMLTAVMVTGAAFAADVDADIGIFSKYIWRGMQLDENPVVQGGVTVSHEKGFYANVWGNYSIQDDYVGKDYDGLNEVDYTVGYAGTADIIDYDIGYIYYTFPNTDYSSTSELYVGIALNNLPVTPSLYVYYDIDGVDGFYAIADLNYGADLSEELSLEVGASLAWASANFNDAYYGRDASSLSDASVYAGLSYAVSDSVSIGASLACTFYPDGAAADAASDSYEEDVNVFGGVNLTYSF